jgi:hypothetical protein
MALVAHEFSRGKMFTVASGAYIRYSGCWGTSKSRFYEQQRELQIISRVWKILVGTI